MALRAVTPIDTRWEFKRHGDVDLDFLPVSRFPTQVHLDLLHHNKIPDPNIGMNELDVQWVGEEGWIYRTYFTTPEIHENQTAVLAFDGLDTVATVLLNWKTILKSDNMFVPERVDVTKSLQPKGEDNCLVILFEPASQHGQRIIEEYPDHHWYCANGDITRLAVRKSQYHWGWDWGPKLMTAGPWRPINLELYSGRISDLYTEVRIGDDLETAEVTTRTDVEGQGSQIRVDVSIDGEIVASETTTVASGKSGAVFKIKNPKIWWPRGYGEQPLYTVRATLLGPGDVDLDVASRRIGLRKAEVVQDAFSDGTPGSSFYFKINNQRIFCGGSNWIPADNFHCRISTERYYDWVKLVVNGNQNMLRVWGGGIYEQGALYDACDEMGVLVWQDFMFGCGIYPAFPKFLESVKKEATENVKLLRHHPSIVIWAGNNEDYQVMEEQGLTCDYADKNPDNWLKSNFPARYIYEALLPSICKDLIPDVFYHPGSPWGAPQNSGDLTVGDAHQWNIWHGSQAKYQDSAKLSGRFISEFGMEAFPSVKTIDEYLPLGKEDPDRYPQSETVDFHNKADGHERRLALYLVENMRYTVFNLEDYVYSTQLMQAECLSSCYRLWRREWRGPGKEKCAGVLVWQINDCWPVTSWAICDYQLRPKHAYHAITRELQPITVGAERIVTSKQRLQSSRRPEILTELKVWASNLTLREETINCTVKHWNIKTGEELSSQKVCGDLSLQPNQSTDLALVIIDPTFSGREASDRVQFVVGVYLTKADGTLLSRYIDWPQPLKYVHFAKPQHLDVKYSAEGSAVEIRAEVPVKGVAVECGDDGVKFEDNLVDIVPGEVVQIGVQGASENSKFTTRCLNLIG